MKKFLVNILVFVSIPVLMHGQRSGGVCISDSLSEAHESAMLHIVSTEKGMLLPTVSLAQRDQIKPLTLGLTIFVKDTEYTGFQYWDGEKWTGLEVINEKSSSLIAPLGGIIMYHGKFNNFDRNGKGLIGTEMEGWQLCNGKNNSPDLSSKFIVSGGKAEELDEDHKDYGRVGNQKITSSKLIITKDNLPAHNHSVNQDISISYNHTHKVYSENKTSLRGKKKDFKNSHTHPYKTHTRGNNKRGHLVRKGSRCGILGRKNCEKSHELESVTVNLKDYKVDTKNANVEFTVDGAVMGTNKGENPEFDNRPKYYVLAFIIRVDDNIEADYGRTFKITY